MKPTLQTLVRQVEETWKKFQAGSATQEHVDTAISDLVEATRWGMAIVLAGKLGDGYTAYGPFEDTSAAEDYAVHVHDNWEVFHLQDPQA